MSGHETPEELAEIFWSQGEAMTTPPSITLDEIEQAERAIDEAEASFGFVHIMPSLMRRYCAAARRGVEADAEIAQIRDALTGDDYTSLPSDLPTVRMAHTIRADHDKFRNQVRDTCQRAEIAEAEYKSLQTASVRELQGYTDAAKEVISLRAELAALKVERDELRAAAASLSADVSALGGELEALKAAQTDQRGPDAQDNAGAGIDAASQARCEHSGPHPKGESDE